MNRILEEISYQLWNIKDSFIHIKYDTIDFFERLFHNGVSRRNCWSLDHHLIDYTTRHLERYKTCSDCYPSTFESYEAWLECLEKMKDIRFYGEEGKEKEFLQAYKLFRKNFGNLWY